MTATARTIIYTYLIGTIRTGSSTDIQTYTVTFHTPEPINSPERLTDTRITIANRLGLPVSRLTILAVSLLTITHDTTTEEQIARWEAAREQ